MKRIEKKELIEKVVPKYIADDGKEFTNEHDCLRYERTFALEKLEDIETNEDADGYPNFDGSECYESHSYTWYRPKNEHEIELLKAAYSYGSHSATEFHDGMIGKWVCVETDCSDDFLWVSMLDDGVEYAKTLLSRLGYDMVVTAKEEQK